MIHIKKKNVEMYCFEVLDVLFRLKDSPIAWGPKY
jgi:hypothetical protein